MNHNIDIIFKKEFKNILECLYQLFGIKTTFFSVDNRELASGGPMCKYCHYLRKKLNFELTCQSLDHQKQQQGISSKKLVSYRCHGGMTEAVLPIFAVKKHIGHIMIGQFRNSKTMPPEIRKSWQKKFRNDLLHKAFLATPYYNKEKTEHILTLFSLLVELVTNKHLITTDSAIPIDRLISHINKNPQANISTSDAAAILNCSTSYLTHNFRKATGQSFKEYLINYKLKKADELLRSDKKLKIYEIAKLVGYSDPFTFSRIYKKYRNHPPSKNIKKTQ